MSFTANFKLAQKGIILVAFPLVCELLFVTYLLQLLHQSEVQRVQSEHARTMIAESDRLLQMFYEAGTSLISPHMARQYRGLDDEVIGAHYSEVIKKIQPQYDLLLKLAKGHQDEEDALATVAPTLTKGQQLLLSVKSSLDSGTGVVTALAELSHKRKAIFGLMREVQTTLYKISGPAKEIERLSPTLQQENSNRILHTIWFGIALNIVVALGLARFFSQSIVSRLNTVTENTHRVARELPLQSPVTGSDEIAQLDRIFHEMAETVVDARRRERAVVDNVLDVICSIDLRGKFKSVNNASTQVWGYEPRELYNMNLQDVIGANQIEAVKSALEGIKATGAGSFECLISKPDGTSIEMQWSASYSEKEDNFFCVAHDVSAQRRVERLKKQFVAMISHDLRTPLNSVLNLLTLVGTGVYGPLDETGERRIAAAEQDVERLIGLINELLQMEKLEAGKLSLNLEKVNLDRLIERSIASIEATAQKKSISITRTSVGTNVMADDARIIQVLVNLLSNAVKATDNAQPISVGGESDGNMSFVSVEDHGCGIPADSLSKIFEPFEQIENETGTKADGFGLGLAISKQIIEQHGGKLTVESVQGRGTKFTFSLLNATGTSANPK